MKKNNYLEEFIINDVLSMSEQDLDQLLSDSGVDPDRAAESLKKRISDVSLRYRKAQFSEIKEALAASRIDEDKSQENILDDVKKSGKSAKDYLIDLIVSGRAPQGLTLAFREGQEITESEAIGIIDDLKSLGYVKDDGSETNN
ncbi:MAG: hypothetical protein COB25_017655 [Oceanospirillales bacterium]|nr:hypothetical protein [Oceanospirillales bacterium]